LKASKPVGLEDNYESEGQGNPANSNRRNGGLSRERWGRIRSLVEKGRSTKRSNGGISAGLVGGIEAGAVVLLPLWETEEGKGGTPLLTVIFAGAKRSETIKLYEESLHSNTTAERSKLRKRSAYAQHSRAKEKEIRRGSIEHMSASTKPTKRTD